MFRLLQLQTTLCIPLFTALAFMLTTSLFAQDDYFTPDPSRSNIETDTVVLYDPETYTEQGYVIEYDESEIEADTAITYDPDTYTETTVITSAVEKISQELPHFTKVDGGVQISFKSTENLKKVALLSTDGTIRIDAPINTNGNIIKVEIPEGGYSVRIDDGPRRIFTRLVL